jgi:hypothetical protein
MEGTIVQKGRQCNHSEYGTLLNMVLFAHPIMDLGASWTFLMCLKNRCTVSNVVRASFTQQQVEVWVFPLKMPLQIGNQEKGGGVSSPWIYPRISVPRSSDENKRKCNGSARSNKNKYFCS